MRTDSATQTGSRLPAWLKLLAGLTTALLLLVGTLAYLGAMATSRWHRYAAAVRAEGQPLILSEIESVRPELAGARNGAAVISDNATGLVSVSAGIGSSDVFVFGADGRKYGLFSGTPRTAVEASRAFRERNREVLNELAKLRERPYGRFEIQHQPNPLTTALPHLVPTRTASKLVRVDTMLKLIDGDFGGVVDNAVLQFNLAGTFHTEPTIIGRLVQIAIQAHGAQTIEQLLRTGELTERQLLRLQDVIERRLSEQTMTWALWGERAIIVETLEQVAVGNVAANAVTGGIAAPTPPWLPKWIVRENQLKAAELYDELIDVRDDPRRLLAVARKLESVVPKLSVKYMLVRILMPRLTRAVELHLRITALLRCTQAALAAERFRLDHDRFPSALDELVPDYLDAVPADPFDGRPLRLTEVETGIVIYSIAEDGTDDGGAVADAERSRSGPDEGLQLFTPEHRGLTLLP